MTEWITSSACSHADCVSVTFTRDGVLVRDTKQRGHLDETLLAFTYDEWAAFIAGVKNGEFDPIEVPSGC